ncbi:hypothetical protein [Solidesulfovibrio sp.]|uniref:hypothetical protein n=1 Tax=Solidesulfovibrio sp. TaxID=2910990 RepID=UPI002B1FC7BB|nr:hypothetical protein [Solidesulfovibrio sp.]MEA5087288.1 hypothetical protein [Solidesulfovibrio sp.]
MTKTAAPHMPDMALAALRVVLIKQCEGVAREMGPIARHLGVVGDNLAAYVRSVPSMPEAEVRAGLQEVAKIGMALKALGRMGLTWPPAVVPVAPEVPPTPAPGSERKQ